MEIEIQLNQAINLKEELIQKLKDNRKKILNNSNKNKNMLDELTFYQTQLSEDLITVKKAINNKNHELGIDGLIYTLSECRELIITYNKLLDSSLLSENEKQKDEIIKSYSKSIKNLNNKKYKIENTLDKLNKENNIKVNIYSDIDKIKKIN